MKDFNNKMAVIGKKDTVLVFRAVGFDTFFTDNEIIKEVFQKVIDQKYPIILITEKDMETINDIIAKMPDGPYPIILPIPDGINDTGFAARKLSANIEKAIGGTKQ